ncbi:MAG: hypothetical protein A2166_04895 [Omnitrophica WOR_2 bacterium RBG_13_41_10]|nr:MAG: hypothetical protein A2166_04895 [Omnitrophica WOR_2 bacterium RBG_13_41_10]
MLSEDILLQVQKPARYIGQEWNISKKDFDQANIKFALCFPELYELGMSNLGIRILYGILNGIQDVACERFFAPAIEMENILRQKNLEILSLESQEALREFDIIGFSLGYELDYTNVLNILDLGKIPLVSSLRNQDYPLVIAGGPCALNPEPMHEFFDFFVIGEAEEAILEIIDLYRKHKEKFKAAKISKKELLVLFSGIEGIYVPSLYEVRYDRQGKIKEFKPNQIAVPARIKKRFVKDLDSAYFPTHWLVPYLELIHDHATVELMRGCPNDCLFCQARQQYYPFRKRKIENIVKLASGISQETGYEEISLGGLSISDYPDIEKLVRQLSDTFKNKNINISLPSLKPKNILGDISSLIASVKKTGLTFAPEAATERLRGILHKDFNIAEFLKAVEKAYALGWQRIKLYFMVGIPSEDESDLDAIIKFASEVSNLKKKVNQRPAWVNLSINTLIPKPHTPFQWFKMEDIASTKHKRDYLKEKIKNPKIKISFHNCYLSWLEGIISRGDRRLSPVISSAFTNRARFDAWDEHFVLDKWLEAFRREKIDPDFYLKRKSPEEILPWDFLDLGVDKSALLAQLNKTVAL